MQIESKKYSLNAGRPCESMNDWRRTNEENKRTTYLQKKPRKRKTRQSINCIVLYRAYLQHACYSVLDESELKI